MDIVINVGGGTYTASYDADGNMVTRNGSQIQGTTDNFPSSIARSLGAARSATAPITLVIIKPRR